MAGLVQCDISALHTWYKPVSSASSFWCFMHVWAFTHARCWLSVACVLQEAWVLLWPPAVVRESA
jgi:hypothetical protein